MCDECGHGGSYCWYSCEGSTSREVRRNLHSHLIIYEWGCSYLVVLTHVGLRAGMFIQGCGILKAMFD